LGSQQQVDTEAAAAGGDVHQSLHELGQLLGHGGELVDDNEQPGERLLAGSRQVGGEILGPDLPKQTLPVAQLGLETGEGAAGEVLVEANASIAWVNETLKPFSHTLVLKLIASGPSHPPVCAPVAVRSSAVSRRVIKSPILSWAVGKSVATS
jgi:hypothetical protein